MAATWRTSSEKSSKRKAETSDEDARTKTYVLCVLMKALRCSAYATTTKPDQTLKA